MREAVHLLLWVGGQMEEVREGTLHQVEQILQAPSLYPAR